MDRPSHRVTWPRRLLAAWWTAYRESAADFWLGFKREWRWVAATPFLILAASGAIVGAVTFVLYPFYMVINAVTR